MANKELKSLFKVKDETHIPRAIFTEDNVREANCILVRQKEMWKCWAEHNKPS